MTHGMTDCSETAKIVLWLGESIGFWIQTGAFLLSAVGAVAVIYYNNSAARKRATIDLVMHQSRDGKFRDGRRTVKKLSVNGEACTRYFEDRDAPEYRAILDVLNEYEFVASGIKEGAFDAGIYKRMQYSIVIADWDYLHGFVVEMRNKNAKPSFYQEFERLATCWKKKPLRTYNK
jgi:hypothetical protein